MIRNVHVPVCEARLTRISHSNYLSNQTTNGTTAYIKHSQEPVTVLGKSHMTLCLTRSLITQFTVFVVIVLISATPSVLRCPLVYVLVFFPPELELFTAESLCLVLPSSFLRQLYQLIFQKCSTFGIFRFLNFQPHSTVQMFYFLFP